ncbi:MAG: hypothetical protein ACRDN0_22975, partial [Trebonia sp.]
MGAPSHDFRRLASVVSADTARMLTSSYRHTVSHARGIRDPPSTWQPPAFPDHPETLVRGSSQNRRVRAACRSPLIQSAAGTAAADKESNFVHRLRNQAVGIALGGAAIGGLVLSGTA